LVVSARARSTAEEALDGRHHPVLHLGRRARVFLVFAIVSAALIPAAPEEFRWFAIVCAAVYLVLAVASYADERSRD
jgi:hypothetical protein